MNSLNEDCEFDGSLDSGDLDIRSLVDIPEGLKMEEEQKEPLGPGHEIAGRIGGREELRTMCR